MISTLHKEGTESEASGDLKWPGAGVGMGLEEGPWDTSCLLGDSGMAVLTSPMCGFMDTLHSGAKETWPEQGYLQRPRLGKWY